MNIYGRIYAQSTQKTMKPLPTRGKRSTCLKRVKRQGPGHNRGRSHCLDGVTAGEHWRSLRLGSLFGGVRLAAGHGDDGRVERFHDGGHGERGDF